MPMAPTSWRLRPGRVFVADLWMFRTFFLLPPSDEVVNHCFCFLVGYHQAMFRCFIFV